MHSYDPLKNILSIERSGNLLTRVTLNFGLLLERYAAQLHGIDFDEANRRVILHTQPGLQADFDLQNQVEIEKILDAGLIPRASSETAESTRSSDLA